MFLLHSPTPEITLQPRDELYTRAESNRQYHIGPPSRAMSQSSLLPPLLRQPFPTRSASFSLSYKPKARTTSPHIYTTDHISSHKVTLFACPS